MASTNDRLSWRERERQMRRQAILDAAQAVFAEKGYENATLEEIAQRAGFGKGTIYNYFEDGKEALLFATFNQIYDEIRALGLSYFTPETVTNRSFRNLFHEFVEACFNFFLEQEELFLILMKEEAKFMFSEDAEKAAYFQEQEHQLVQALVPSLEAAMQASELKSFPPHAVGHLLGGNINGLMMHIAMMRHSELPSCGEPAISTPEEGADFLTTMLFDGLAHETPSMTNGT